MEGDDRQIRFRFCAFTALKYALRAHWLTGVADESKYAVWELHSRHSMREFMENQAIFLTYLLDLADEARALLASL